MKHQPVKQGQTTTLGTTCPTLFDKCVGSLTSPASQLTLGTLRYEDGKARTATAVDAGNFRGSRRVAKKKMLKMCIAKDGDVNNLNFT